MEIIYRTPEPIKLNGLYYVKVELVDGTSQILQISKEQAVQLGIDLSGETPEIALQICPEKNQTQELVVDANGFILQQVAIGNENVTEYRVLQPEEMNLKPLKKGPIKQRLKRSFDDIVIVKPAKKVKTVRTRSGRITVPPKHMQNIYKQFLETTTPTETAEVSRSPSPLLIGDFTPLSTNGNEVPLQTVQTTPKPANRNIVINQYRCATCNKAYIAKAKLRKHFKMYPDHKPKDTLNVINNRTWDFLMDTSRTAAIGKRGVKFCHELAKLLHNVKVIVKYVFKLQEKLDSYDDLSFKEGDLNGRGHYLMNEVLTELLGIDKGWYTFNDKEWYKDVSIFSFLNNFDSGGDLSALSINDNMVTAVSAKDNQENNKDDVVIQAPFKIVDENADNLIKKEPINDKSDDMSLSEFLNENMSNQVASASAKQNTVDSNGLSINVGENTQANVELALINKKDRISPSSSSSVSVISFGTLTPIVKADNSGIIKMMVDDSLLVVGNLDKQPPLEIFQFDSSQ